MNRQLNLEVVGQGIPMVLLHGWGWSASIWKPLVSDLKDDFQLYLVDLPGLGHSPFFSDQDSFKDMANLLFQVVPEEAVWLGWSLGGMLAFWVASHHPEKVSRLVTVAASPKFIADGSWPGVSLKTLAKFSETLLKEYTKTLEDFLELQLRGSLHAEELFASLKKDLPTLNDTRLIVLLNGLRLLRETDLRSDLSRISCPSLSIFGAHDTLVPARVAQLMQPMLPRGHCEIIPRAGHMPFLSQRTEFIEMIKNFILESQ